MNRELVERATHPKVLEAITSKLGEAWKEHGINTAGGYIADVQTAQSHLIRRDRSFFTGNQDVCFPGNTERVRTRLGDDRIEIAFDPNRAAPLAANALGIWGCPPGGCPRQMASRRRWDRQRMKMGL